MSTGAYAAMPPAHTPSVNPPASVLVPQPAAGPFRKIGPVARNLWPFNALEIYDPRLKADVFYLTSFNSAGRGQLIRLDYEHKRASSWTLPVGIGSWGIIQGKDGNIYLGSYNGGELLCFDPRTEQWISIPQAPADFRKREPIICDLAEAPNGDIYYGTYPGAHLVRYSPRLHTVTDLGRVADENYLRRVVVTPEGLVLCYVGTRHSRIRVFDPRIGTFTDLEPAKSDLTGAPSWLLVRGNDLIVSASVPAGTRVSLYNAHTLHRERVFTLPDVESVQAAGLDHLVYQQKDKLGLLDLRDGETKLVCNVPKVLHGSWFSMRNGGFLGLRVQSYFYLHPHSHQLEHSAIDVQGLGQNVLWLRSTASGLIFGGPALGQTMFSYRPATQKLLSYDQIIDEPGEIYYGVPHNGKLYLVSYIEAVLSVYDPHRPWSQGSLTDPNPRTLLHLPDRQYRPVGGIHEGPGHNLYIGTQPDYGLVGGALSVFNPDTQKIEVHRNIIPNQEIGAIATDERYVYAESDPSGGGGSKPETTGVHFFVWDPASHKMIFDHTFAGVKGFSSIAAANGHAYFVMQRQLMDYDRRSGSLQCIYKFSKDRDIPLESLQAAANGTLWGILGHELAHIDPSRRNVRFFPETDGHATSGLTIAADGTVYFGSGTDVWFLRPQTPSPPQNFGQ